MSLTNTNNEIKIFEIKMKEKEIIEFIDNPDYIINEKKIEEQIKILEEQKNQKN